MKSINNEEPVFENTEDYLKTILYRKKEEQGILEWQNLIIKNINDFSPDKEIPELSFILQKSALLSFHLLNNLNLLTDLRQKHIFWNNHSIDTHQII